MPLPDELVDSYVHSAIVETGCYISSDSTTTDDSSQDLYKHTEAHQLDCAVEKASGENSKNGYL